MDMVGAQGSGASPSLSTGSFVGLGLAPGPLEVSSLETERVGAAPPEGPSNSTCFIPTILQVISVGQGSGLTPSHPPPPLPCQAFRFAPTYEDTDIDP